MLLGLKLLLGPSQASPRPVMGARGKVELMAGLDPFVGLVEAVLVQLVLYPSLGVVEVVAAEAVAVQAVAVQAVVAEAVVAEAVVAEAVVVQAVVVQLVMKLQQRCFSPSSFLSLVAQDPVPAHPDASERGGGAPLALSSHLCTGVDPFP